MDVDWNYTAKGRLPEQTYVQLELTACIDRSGDGDIECVYDQGERFDFVTIYGRLEDGRREAVHDFDASVSKQQALVAAYAVADIVKLPLVDCLPS